MSIRVTIAKWLAPELVDAELHMNAMRTIKAMALHGEKLSSRLRNIAALRTPKCANAARRMADIAEEALK